MTDVALEPTPSLELDCGACRLCIDACPTGALDDPGTLDATRCLSYWTQAAEPIPHEHRDALGSQVYGCDICQDVCPWNRGVEKRRADAPGKATPHVSLVDWLSADRDELAGEFERLFVPRNDGRWLQRNALVALGNVGELKDLALGESYLEGDDEMLREHAEWAVDRIRARHAD